MSHSSLCVICSIVVLLSVACDARRLRGLQELSKIAQQAPIQLGDGTETIITSASMRRKGGAMKALGRSGLSSLRKRSMWQGTLVDLAHLMDNDDDLAVDAVNVALMYICEGLAVNSSEISSGVAPSQQDASISLSQAFSLSSRPESKYKIFLDFDGHITTGTAWNTAKGRDPIVTPPFDKDSDPTTFSSDELSTIVAIWRAVSEDYAMFDVDVTTADPGAALIGNGIRVAIGGSYSDWYGATAGGVAYINSFGSPKQEPCFIFADNLSKDVKYMSVAISHEVGHTLGLHHDGSVTAGSYYKGNEQGNWAPIMGAAYYKNIATFDKGEFTGATNPEDDLAVMGRILPLVPQRFGNDTATATPLVGTLDAATGLYTAQVAGVVTDANGDWFSFISLEGSATLSVAVVTPWGDFQRANLDAQLTIINSAGAVVQTLNPASLDVPATVVGLPAMNRYYVAVQGVGSGDPATTGYSSYGSKGQYELTVVYTPPPQMQVASISMSRNWKDLTTKTAYKCTANVYVRDMLGMPLAGVKVTGVWTLTTGGVTTVTDMSDLTTAATGVAATFATVRSGAPGSCSFTMRTAAMPAYWYNAAIGVKSRTLSWSI